MSTRKSFFNCIPYSLQSSLFFCLFDFDYILFCHQRAVIHSYIACTFPSLCLLRRSRVRELQIPLNIGILIDCVCDITMLFVQAGYR